jgi:hypothetical protein
VKWLTADGEVVGNYRMRYDGKEFPFIRDDPLLDDECVGRSFHKVFVTQEGRRACDSCILHAMLHSQEIREVELERSGP